MHVDQPRADDHAGRIERTRRLQPRLRPDAGNLRAANPQLGDLIQALRRINEAAVDDA